MDSFELNKILGAVLGTCLILLSLNIAAGAIFSTHAPSKPGYEIAIKEEAGGKEAGPAPAEEPLPVRLASAEVGRGETSAKKCAACHTFGKGEPNRVGPNLYGVVGRAKASEAGFNYSAAMKGQKGNWTLEELDHFIANPKAAVPGTNMTFAGIARGKERADLLAYLNSKADNPAPLPKAAAAPAAPEKQAATPPAASPAAAPASAPPAAAGQPPAAPPAPSQAAAPPAPSPAPAGGTPPATAQDAPKEQPK